MKNKDYKKLFEMALDELIEFGCPGDEYKGCPYKNEVYCEYQDESIKQCWQKYFEEKVENEPLR